MTGACTGQEAGSVEDLFILQNEAGQAGSRPKPIPTISLNFIVEILNLSFLDVCLGFGGSFSEAVQSARVIKVEDSLSFLGVIGRIRNCHILLHTDPTSEN